jgi:pyruvate dehydrogenase E2 component (dihydrolipoamide acetyltransferase)
MPQLGETVTEGTITRWMKSVGDHVERDEPLFEVSTDKVDSEVPAPASGVVAEIVVPEGETVPVGARLAVISDGTGAMSSSSGGEAASEVPGQTSPPPPQAGAPGASAAPQAAAPAAPQAAAPAAPQAAAPQAAAPAYEQPPPAQPAPPAQSPPPSPSAPPPPPAGYVPRSAESEPAAPSTLGAVPGSADAQRMQGMLLSPVVRRLLDEHGISPSEIAGTGLGGRITREDVLGFIDARRAGTTPASQAVAGSSVPQATPPQATPPQAVAGSSVPQAPPPQAPAPTASLVGGPVAAVPAPTAATAVLRPSADRVVPFSNMRRRTAEHMIRSKVTSPHAYIAYEADFENVERVRRAWRERFKSEEGFSLTYLPFIARATVDALREFPNLNSSVVEDALVVHQQVNLGIAVDLNHEGLIVPVIHHAEEITLRGIARRVRDLAERARNRQLSADDIAGGTFSITNDGPFGTYFTVPIINQPQVGILATDGVRRRPVVVELPDGSESIAVHSVGVIGLSWDHRAVDGAYVSSFLRRVAQVLATRDWASEL